METEICPPGQKRLLHINVLGVPSLISWPLPSRSCFCAGWWSWPPSTSWVTCPPAMAGSCWWSWGRAWSPLQARRRWTGASEKRTGPKTAAVKPTPTSASSNETQEGAELLRTHTRHFIVWSNGRCDRNAGRWTLWCSFNLFYLMFTFISSLSGVF